MTDWLQGSLHVVLQIYKLVFQKTLICSMKHIAYIHTLALVYIYIFLFLSNLWNKKKTLINFRTTVTSKRVTDKMIGV
jgi:hypothetical protein